jgi:hypothetical protein
MMAWEKRARVEGLERLLETREDSEARAKLWGQETG